MFISPEVDDLWLTGEIVDYFIKNQLILITKIVGSSVIYTYLCHKSGANKECIKQIDELLKYAVLYYRKES